MKEFKNVNFKTVEFWAATTLFVFAVFMQISNALRSSWGNQDASAGIINNRYFFTASLCRYILYYSSFLLLSLRIVPRLVRKENIAFNILLILLIFLALGFVLGLAETELKYMLVPGSRNDVNSYNNIFQRNFLYAAWLLLMFGFYTVIKQFALYLFSHSDDLRQKYEMSTPGSLVAFVIWMISLFLLVVSGAEGGIIFAWCTIIPCGLLLYMYSLHLLIPKALSRKKPFRLYLVQSVLLALISIMPVALLGSLLLGEANIAVPIGFLNAAFQLLFTVPLSWLVFRRRMKGNEEIFSLKRELGQSYASIDFLRSQINPHFLFNALNTIYGTALQEKADRTAEGVERLGDMMRFMLQENMQEKISLTREIDYLQNYISLQKLRTDPNPCIRIETVIQEEIMGVDIAPMLLIPFVENAFKHGISFREASYIRVTLEYREGTLYFDVNNSKHQKAEEDPEKDKSGIGLKNVQQRLKLLYPGRHELVVRETAKDFFIHLTLELKKSLN
jgi:two-component system, LytTR family, sensor kinase